MTRLHAVAALAYVLTACVAQPPANRFETWRMAHHGNVEAYETFLRSEGVAGILPTKDLLRSGRRWERCRAEEFVVPPRQTWAAMPATLRAVREMRSAGVIKGPIVASSFRTPNFNRCEGGSTKSRHLANNALDFDLHTNAGQDLCDWWRSHGKKHAVGLGFYSPKRIHIDTAGFRSWGSDHTAKTSLCAVSS